MDGKSNRGFLEVYFDGFQTDFKSVAGTLKESFWWQPNTLGDILTLGEKLQFCTSKLRIKRGQGIETEADF